MCCFHTYELKGAFWQECKVIGCNYGYKVFYLYKCKKCGKEKQKRILKEGVSYIYDDKIANLTKNGYKHINTYRIKE